MGGKEAVGLLLDVQQRYNVEIPVSSYPSAEGQPGMGFQRLSVGIGREKGHNLPFPVAGYQRTVPEAVGMVIHVVPQKKKRAIAGRTHESVPLLPESGRILFYGVFHLRGLLQY